MICKNCNSEIPNDSEYCSFCGNVAESVISLNSASGLKKGYTYLELKQWKDAEQFFRNAIIDGDNKSEAYIGKMLARYKADSIENLAASGKKFISDDDFKLALKYADGEYAEYLKKCALSGAKKSKKITIIVSSICAFVMVVALLSYFVLIPLNRISNYQNLLADGKVQEAVKSYTGSKWFEYDQKAKDLFYENGLRLVEVKDYKKAKICFEITNGYADNEKYLDYCKAQNLLADNDLESYNYFTDLGDFLDSKEILNTNKYFVMVNKLQGEWEHPKLKPYENRDTSNIKQGFVDEIFYATNNLTIVSEKISIDGITVFGEYTKGKLVIFDDTIFLYNERYEENYSIDCVSDNSIKIEHDLIGDIEWTKVE